MKNAPYAFVCLWEYKPDERKTTLPKLWHLVECFGVDQDGYACTKTKYAKGGRQPWQNWMNKKVWYDKEAKQVVDSPPTPADEEDFDYRPISGRAVTVWSTESGVSLAEFMPPVEVDWLADSFYKKLKKSKKWYEFIEDGYTLYGGTARAVEKFIHED